LECGYLVVVPPQTPLCQTKATFSDEAVHAVEVLRGMSAGNVPKEKLAFGSDCLRELPAGAGGLAQADRDLLELAPRSISVPLPLVRKMVSDEKRPGYSSAQPPLPDSLKALLWTIRRNLKKSLSLSRSGTR
jgi:hypothetical protein